MHMGVSFNGKTVVSKTTDRGSIPLAPANFSYESSHEETNNLGVRGSSRPAETRLNMESRQGRIRSCYGLVYYGDVID